MAADLEKIKRKRSGAAGWLTRAQKTCEKLVGEIKSDSKSVDICIVEDAIQNFDKRLKTWDEAEEELEVLLDEDKLEGEIASAADFREKCVCAKLELKKEWRKINSDDNTSNYSSSGGSTVKLPKLELPKYHGDALKFTAFWQQFTAAVDHQEMPNVSKFNYLIACLRGKAKSVLEGLPITSEHYDTAKDLVQKRFGRKESLIFAHVQALLKLVVPEVKDVEKLMSFSDELVANVRALEALGIKSDQFGVILTPLLVSKLPEEIRMEWSRDSEKKEGDLAFLLDFLEKEICRRNRSSPFSTCQEIERKPPKGGSSTGSALITEEFAGCKFCGKSHRTLKCYKFKNANPKDRQVMVGKAGLCYRCLKEGHRAKDCKAVCDNCNKPHHEFLCYGSRKPQTSADIQSGEKPAEAGAEADGSSDLTQLTMAETGVTILPTIDLKIKGRKDWYQVTALLDSGSSKSYISRKIVRKVKPKWVCRVDANCAVFGGLKMKSKRDVYELTVDSLEGEKSFNLTEVPVICAPLWKPRVRDCLESFEHLKVVNHFSSQGSIEIDMLIGLDLYWEVVKSGVFKPDNGVVAQETIFGWVLSGSERSSSESLSALSLLSMEDIPENLQHCFWDLDSIGVRVEETVNPVVKDFLENIQFVDSEGRYEVGLPYKSLRKPESNLKNNVRFASKLNVSLEKRLDKNPEFKEKYHAALHEMESLDFIEEVPEAEIEGKEGSVFYLPHHPCVRESSTTTKIRPVFNASIKGPNGVSLNDCLESGPNLNPTVMEVMLRFRRWPVALSADITKAFMQIMLRPSDRDVHRFLWTVGGQTRIMRFKRVTFGVSCSPFILAAILRYHLSLCVPSRAVMELSENLYVDDILTGDNTETGAHNLFSEANEIMLKAGMQLAKWTSNKVGIIGDGGSTSQDEFRKILGMNWESGADELKFDGIEVTDVVCSKRVVLVMLARIYDPMGLILPFTVTAKFLFQNLWRLGLSWDEGVPKESADEFKCWTDEIPQLKIIRIPRQYFSGPWPGVNLQIHAFGDSSLKGYGACVYLTCEVSGEIQVALVKSCARVAPLQKVTLPRLELLGALITSRLVNYVRKQLHIENDVPYSCYTDSMIALSWIRSSPSQWKPWVANRVSEIQELTGPEYWHHCPGVQNPADLLTRGCSGEKLAECELWWKGPPFLRHPDLKCKIQNVSTLKPKPSDEVSEVIAEMKRGKSEEIFSCQMVNVSVEASILEHCSTLNKAYSAIGWIFRFVSNVRAKAARQPIDKRKQLSSEEYSNAKTSFIKLVQRKHFWKEMKLLEKGKSLPADSKLSKLNPYVDKEGILRVKSRITLSELSFESKCPTILPKCPEVLLLVRSMHHSLNHAGVDTLIAAIRSKYEVFGLRNMAKKVKKNCVACQRLDVRACDQEEAPLPRLRVTKAPAFTVTGIDLAGPVFCADSEEKFYICLFVCGVIRALHLELVESMWREDFMMAYRRFCALKRAPSIVYSDNAKNFTSSKKLLRRYLGPVAPEWRLICPRSPWWGGWWERLVRSTKSALRKTVGKNCLTKVELQTCLHEVAASINSRPLTFVGTDIDTRPPLTPNHFLSGLGSQGLENVVEDVDQVSTEHLAEREQEALLRLDDFWQVWSSEYLRSLPPSHQKFRKRGNLQVGSIVVVKEDGLPRMKWMLGRVLRLHAGRDGLPRAADLKTKSGVRTRAVQRLYNLEVEGVQDSEDTGDQAEALGPENGSSNSNENANDNVTTDQIARSVANSRPKRSIKLPMRYANFDLSG